MPIQHTLHQSLYSNITLCHQSYEFGGPSYNSSKNPQQDICIFAMERLLRRGFPRGPSEATTGFQWQVSMESFSWDYGHYEMFSVEPFSLS